MRGMNVKRLNVATEGCIFDRLENFDRWLQVGALMEHPGRWTIVTWAGDTTTGLGTADKIERNLDTRQLSMRVKVQKKWGIDLDNVNANVNFIPQMATASKDGKIMYIIAAYITEVTLELKGPKNVAAPEEVPAHPQTPIPM